MHLARLQYQPIVAFKMHQGASRSPVGYGKGPASDQARLQYGGSTERSSNITLVTGQVTVLEIWPEGIRLAVRSQQIPSSLSY